MYASTCVYIFASNYFRGSSLCICHILFNIPQWRTSRFTTNNARTNILICVLLWTQMWFSFLGYITRKVITESCCVYIPILTKSCQIASQNGSTNLHIQILFSRVKFIFLVNVHCVKPDSRQPGFLFFFFFGCMACGMLVPLPGMEPMPSAVKAQSPTHWTARGFPARFYESYIYILPMTADWFVHWLTIYGAPVVRQVLF